MKDRPVRLAIVGGNRGGRFKRTLAALAGLVELAAICDLREEVLRDWKEEFPWIRGYTSYDRLLEDPEVDAVLLASPMLLHAKQAVLALDSGKHVLSEVIAAHTLEDAWELVETVERTGLVYMLGENYCFERSAMTVLTMAERGAFGELTYLEGGYIHELRSSVHAPDGSPTWRGELHRQYNGMNYPTHSIGPIAQWLGLGRRSDDRLESMSTFVSGSRSLRKYFHERFGPEHPASRDGYWQQGDSAVTTISTQGGALITLRVDWSSVRPHNMHHYVAQGTEGAFVSRRHDFEEDLVWFEGRSPRVAAEHGGKPEDRWEPLSRYRPEFDHPSWTRLERMGDEETHGGSNTLVLEEFAAAIREQRRPAIDVYDAASWSSIFPLSMESWARQGQPVRFPDFRRGERREG